MKTLLDAFRDVRERAEEAMATADAARRQELQRMLNRIRRQENAARRMA
jgi:hypothetical protein